MGRLMLLLLHRAETSCLIIGDTSVVIQIKALRKRQKSTVSHSDEYGPCFQGSHGWSIIITSGDKLNGFRRRNQVCFGSKELIMNILR